MPETAADFTPRTPSLRAGDMTLDLAPEIGGAIAGWRSGEVELLRRMGQAALAARDVRQAGCFPTIPYSNRLRECTLRFRGRTHRLAPNFGAHPHSIHGNAWQRPWAVADMGAASATLVFEHDAVGPRAAEWPFPYKATQRFTLDAAGLTIALEIVNTGDAPAPAGLGLHPYFPRAANTRLTTSAGGYWRNDEAMMPVAFEPVPPAWNFAEGKLVAPLAIDNCFAGWSGFARIELPELGRAISIAADPAFGHAVIFVPPGRPFFCVEPVTNANDGMNRMDKGAADTGVWVLDPGRALSGQVRFEVEKL
ncbi:MAG: aldose 1-epimerase [Tagaea sp.]